MINGIAEIRAYGQEERFKAKFEEYSFMKATVDFHEAIGEAWIKIRIEYPIAIILALTIGALTFGKDLDYVKTDDLAIIGLLLIYLLNVGN